MPVIKERIKLNNSAHQKPSTWKPDTNLSANKIMNAFMAKRKNPSVKIVIGIVKMVRMGFTIEFKKANTTATNKADK